MFGAVDCEDGLLLVPAMLVSAYAGMEAILVADVNNDTSTGAAFIAGIRIAWKTF